MSPQKIIEQLNEIKMMITKGNQFQKEIFTIKDLMAYTGFSDSTIHKLSAKKNDSSQQTYQWSPFL